jgi:hypothetical protein
MALSLVERKLLRRALHALQEEQEHYICDAINGAHVPAEDETSVQNAKIRLCDFIQTHLFPSATLGGWIVHQSPRGRHYVPTAEALREARIAWVKWMLEEDYEIPDAAKEELERCIGRPIR